MADALLLRAMLQACEQAKRELSEHTTAALSEEFIATVDGKPLNLKLDVERQEYEALILPLVEPHTVGATAAATGQAMRRELEYLTWLSPVEAAQALRRTQGVG